MVMGELLPVIRYQLAPQAQTRHSSRVTCHCPKGSPRRRCKSPRRKFAKSPHRSSLFPAPQAQTRHSSRVTCHCPKGSPRRRRKSPRRKFAKSPHRSSLLRAAGANASLVTCHLSLPEGLPAPTGAPSATLRFHSCAELLYCSTKHPNIFFERDLNVFVRKTRRQVFCN